MSNISKKITKILTLIFVLSCSGITLSCTNAMEEIYQNPGTITIEWKNPKGETFIKDDNSDWRLFLISDVNNAQQYATYPTDRKELLTIQDTPGEGRCGDYVLGISREKLIKKIDKAVERKDLVVLNFLEFIPPYKEDLSEYNFLEIESDPHFDAHNSNIRSMMQLAAYLFKFNLEIYYPQYDSLGESVSFGMNARNFRLIKELKLHFNANYGGQDTPVMRLLHMGRLYGFRQTGGLHYRYLYNPSNLQEWERKKVQRLEKASRQKYEGCAYILGKKEYELTCEEIIPIQKEGLKYLKKKPVLLTQNHNSPSVRIETPIKSIDEDFTKSIDIAAGFIENLVKGGSEDDYLRHELDEAGFDASIFETAIALAKSNFSQALENQNNNLNVNIKDSKRLWTTEKQPQLKIIPPLLESNTPQKLTIDNKLPDLVKVTDNKILSIEEAKEVAKTAEKLWNQNTKDSNTEAVKLFQDLFNQKRETGPAAYRLGVAYYFGRGVEKNLQTAFDYLSLGKDRSSLYWRGLVYADKSFSSYSLTLALEDLQASHKMQMPNVQPQIDKISQLLEAENLTKK